MTPRLPSFESQSLSVFVIHNGDKARLNQTVLSLSNFFGAHWQNTKSTVLEKQPPFRALNRIYVFERIVYSLGIALKNQVRLRKSWLGYVQVVGEHLLQMMQIVGPGWSKLQKRVFAELALTEKHILAFRKISQNYQFGLVVEDDIQSTGEVELRFEDLLSIPSLVKSNCVYVSLCVAFTVNQLGIKHLVEDGPPKFSTVSEGVANTTAAYWITKAFADRILVEIESDSKLKLLPADWLITEAFRRIPEAKCLYLNVGVFLNGSLFGLSPSEIRP